MPIRIAVDAMGGDHAPEALVQGAIAAAKANQELQIVLVGQTEALPQEASLPENVTVEAAATVMAMDESVENLRKKKDSSIWVATKMVKDGRADAVVSAGSTGAQMACSLLLLGRIPGITRPAIALTFPNRQGGSVVLDVGANVQIAPEQYLQFGFMGSICAETVLHKANPKIALLSNGTEEHKGTDDIIAAHQLLKASDLNFIGNIESRSIMDGIADVIVTDGFTGNILIKTAEGIAHCLFGMIKEELTASFSRKIGAMLVKGGFKEIKKMMDYKEYGGAPLLGVNGISIVCHGSSDARAVQNAIRVAADCVESQFVEKITEKASAYTI